MPLQGVVIVRHGHEDRENCCSSEDGQRQMFSLGGQLRVLTLGFKTLILFSTRPRAIHSAGILQGVLGTSAIPTPLLVWDDDKRPENEDIDALLALIRSFESQYDLLILVTHLMYLNILPGRIAKEVWHKDLPPGFDSLADFNYGTGLLMPWGSPKNPRVEILVPKVP